MFELSDEEIETYSTIEDSGKIGTNDCFSCTEQECILVQASIKKALKKALSKRIRPPLTTLDPNVIESTEHAKPMCVVNVEDSKVIESIEDAIPMCGNEGMVYVFSETIVKICPSTKKQHQKRIKLWIEASRHMVGPLLLSCLGVSWFEEWKEWNMKSGSLYTGWSGLETEKLRPIEEINIAKILELIQKCANVGMLHMDPSTNNIMTRKEEYVFIDWEDGRMFKPQTNSNSCIVCEFAKFVMIQLFIYKNDHRLGATLKEHADDMNIKLEDNDYRNSFYLFLLQTNVISSKPPSRETIKTFFQSMDLKPVHAQKMIEYVGVDLQESRSYRGSSKQAVSGVCVLGEYGHIMFESENSQTNVICDLKNLTPGKHGFHVHTAGDIRHGCNSACAHYNPTQSNHGGPNGHVRHKGDLGNILVTSDRTCKDRIQADVTVQEIIGRMIVIHENEDDLGAGQNEDSKLTGNSGNRIACGIIGYANI